MLDQEEKALVAQIANLSFADTSDVKIAETLQLTRYKVQKIKKSEEYQAYLAEVREKATAEIAAKWAARMESLEPLAYEALRQNLKDKKIEAVKVWAQYAVPKQEGEKESQDTSIQIVLPGAQAPDQKPIIDITEEANAQVEDT